MSADRWVTLRDVYRCALDPERIERKIEEVGSLVAPQAGIRIRSAELAARPADMGDWSWTQAGGGTVRTADEPALREKLASLGTAFEVEAPAADPARRERLDAVRRGYGQDWLMLDPKLRSSIIEGLSVFLSVFDLPDVAQTFCPPPPAPGPPPAPAAGAEAAAVARPLPPLDEVIDEGKVLALNMPAGINPALARAVGVLLKQAWLQTLLRRPAEMQRRPGASSVPRCSSATSTRPSPRSARTTRPATRRRSR